MFRLFMIAASLAILISPALNEATAQEQLPRLYMSASSVPSDAINPVGTTTPLHKVSLKALKTGNDITLNPDFQLDTSSIFKIPFGNYLYFSSQPLNEGFTVTGAIITPNNNRLQQMDLISVAGQKNAYSLVGHSPGVYFLDVVGQVGQVKGAYETMLQILPQLTPSVVPQVQPGISLVEKKTVVVHKDSNDGGHNGNEKSSNTCLFYPDSKPCHQKNGECPKGLVMNGNFGCFPDKECPDGLWRADDDESGACVPKPKEHEDGNGLKKYDSCPAGSANPGEGCELNGEQCGPDGCGTYSHGVCETCSDKKDEATTSVDVPAKVPADDSAEGVGEEDDGKSVATDDDDVGSSGDGGEESDGGEDVGSSGDGDEGGEQ